MRRLFEEVFARLSAGLVLRPLVELNGKYVGTDHDACGARCASSSSTLRSADVRCGTLF
mgnify:CR=1 FL=1